ncbi:MAG: DUF4345 domain-containing protein [Agitococcus sp.]|jgi:hypothetical protein|nr:DUF4345 domain-containing protein [Agitococcus sp.]
MMRLTQIFLLLSGIGFMLIGINTFRDPIAAMAGVELGVQSINALNEVRANYGGMQMGIGILLFSAALLQWLSRSALLALSLITGGLVVGRLVSIMLDGMPNTTVQALLILEFVTTVAAIFLFFQHTKNAE